MKIGYVFGALLGLVAGVGATIGVNEYLAIKSELKAVQSKSQSNTQAAPTLLQEQQPQPAVVKSAQLVSAPAPSPVAQPSPATQLNFDSLSPCDQLDSIARGGKSVSDFLVASAKVSALPKYEAAIASICPWNAEQLAVANRILHPPVVKVQTVVRRQAVVVDEPVSNRSVVVTEPAPAWNNCNGIQEPGESYSAACHKAQSNNDRWDKKLDPIDQRQPDAFGEKPPANGYNAR